MLDLDMREYKSVAETLAILPYDQIPFALSGALTDAAFEHRKEQIDEIWPANMAVRNKRFIGAALRVEKASKTTLSVSIYDRLGRASLQQHARGGIKKARGRLAIPSEQIKRTSKGVSKRQRPAALTGKNIRVTQSGIFRAHGGQLQRLYSFAPSAKIKQDFDFYPAFKSSMPALVHKFFPNRLRSAMRSARRRAVRGR